jgi:hypothetical protein
MPEDVDPENEDEFLTDLSLLFSSQKHALFSKNILDLHPLDPAILPGCDGHPDHKLSTLTNEEFIFCEALKGDMNSSEHNKK